tara:strand:- start:84 stop:242 length:159 start_codon:yes stop_codon:yes gene_type:complete
MRKINQIAIAILCIGGFFKHNSYPYANILVSIGFATVAITFILMAFSKNNNQ